MIVAATTLSGLVSAAGTIAAQPVPTPGTDPFYAAPADLAGLADGTVLQSRPIEPFGIGLGPLSRFWQVQYKSTDSRDRATTGVATIAVPATPWTGPGARPLVSYQLAEDSLGINCTPSYSIRAGLAAGINNTNSEFPAAFTLLQRNWAVVLADYQGPEQRFLDGPQEAHGVLDGIRAARSFTPAGLADSPVGLIGYSGGGFATSSAAGLQTTYAPELPIVGIAMGGLPADLAGSWRATSGTYSAGLGLLALTALDRIAPEAGIPALLNDRGRAVLAENTRSCGVDFVAKYAFANFDDYTAVPDLPTDPRFLALAPRIMLDNNVPAVPTYVWHSTGDDVLPISGTDATVQKWCAAGAQLTYRRTSTPTHGAAALTGIFDAIDYLGRRFVGEPAPAGCS